MCVANIFIGSLLFSSVFLCVQNVEELGLLHVRNFHRMHGIYVKKIQLFGVVKAARKKKYLDSIIWEARVNHCATFVVVII